VKKYFGKLNKQQWFANFTYSFFLAKVFFKIFGWGAVLMGKFNNIEKNY